MPQVTLNTESLKSHKLVVWETMWHPDNMPKNQTPNQKSNFQYFTVLVRNYCKKEREKKNSALKMVYCFKQIFQHIKPSFETNWYSEMNHWTYHSMQIVTYHLGKGAYKLVKQMQVSL